MAIPKQVHGQNQKSRNIIFLNMLEVNNKDTKATRVSGFQLPLFNLARL